MATQQELDDAVVAAAQQLSATLNQLDSEERQRLSFKDQRDSAEAQRVIHAQAVKNLRDQIKTQATTLNNAITAANAGPTP